MATPRINHNSLLTDVHRSLAIHNANTGRQITQLSSGLRINRYSDDPASLALADGISSEVRAIAEGTRNIQQTFSLLQVADGSLNEIGDMVNRMRALAMQGATATLNDGNRLSISSEFNSLREEIDRIASTTTYNGRRLLTGGNNTLNRESTALAAAPATGLTDIHVTNAELGTYTFVDEPDDGLLTLGNGVHTQSVNIADFLNEEGIVPDRAFHKIRFERLGVEVTLTGDGVSGAPGRYSDGVLDGQTLIIERDANLTFQVGPSGTSNDVSRVVIKDMRATGPQLNLGSLSFVTQVDAQNALKSLTQARDTVTDERNRLGAFQSRLQLSISTSESVMMRMIDSESRIREVDVARAAAGMTHSQILAQAATSIAGTADTDIDRILTLLR